MLDRSRLEKIGAIFFALAVWQLGAKLLGQDLLLVAPTTVIQRLYSLWITADFWRAIGFTFARIVLGFSLALLVGSLLATLAAKYHLVEVIIWPFVATIKSIPVASFIILCLIWLSASNLSVFISLVMAFPIIYTNILQGIRSTDHKLLEMANLFRVNWLKRIKYIYLPQLRPYLTSASSVAIGLSWKAGVAAEVIGIPAGSIGERLYEAKVYLSTSDLFAWTVVIVAVSIVFEKAFLLLLQGLFARLEKS
ncbi:MAG: ABC transporter permease subunit [Firmicutes bacterium]|nr:ABC transporter permease subunit [Bacillota bacterium]